MDRTYFLDWLLAQVPDATVGTACIAGFCPLGKCFDVLVSAHTYRYPERAGLLFNLPEWAADFVAVIDELPGAVSQARALAVLDRCQE